MPGVSACLIVRNEERFLERCLQSIRPWVSEICVLDTGSIDRTVVIAREFGARVETFAWCDDFARARNVGLGMASEPWILAIDADEILLAANGPNLALATADASGSQLAWLVLRDDLRADGSAETLALPRLFRNRPDIRYSRPVHEDIMDSLFALGVRQLEPCGVRLRHYGYLPEVLAVLDKPARNLRILRRRAREAPEDLYSAWKLAVTLALPSQREERLAAFEAAHALAESLDDAQAAEFPFLPPVYDGFAAALLAAGAVQRATAIVDRGLQRFPRALELTFRRGDIALRTRDVETAIRHFRACSQTVGSGDLFYHQDASQRGVRPLTALARIALWAGDPRQAETLIRSALLDSKENAEARCLEVRILLHLRREPEAMNRLGRLLDDAPITSDVQLLGGELAWEGGDRDGSRELFRAAEGESVAGNEARAWLSLTELCEGRREAATLALTDLVRNDAATAAYSILLDVMSGIEQVCDPAFAPATLLAATAPWLRQIRARGADSVQQSMLTKAGATSPGIAGLEALVRVLWSETASAKGS